MVNTTLSSLIHHQQEVKNTQSNFIAFHSELIFSFTGVVNEEVTVCNVKHKKFTLNFLPIMAGLQFDEETCIVTGS